MKKRILAFILAAIMVVSLLPVAAFAEPDPVPDGETVPYTVTVKTPDLGGRIVTAKFFTTSNAMHVPEQDVTFICDGRTYDIADCNGKNQTAYNAKYWKSRGTGCGQQANVLFETDDPTVSINEQWSWIIGPREGEDVYNLHFGDNVGMTGTNRIIVDSCITEKFDFSVKSVGYEIKKIPFTAFADGNEIPVGDNNSEQAQSFDISKTFDELNLPDDVDAEKLTILNCATEYYSNPTVCSSTVTASKDASAKKITLSGSASYKGPTKNAWSNNNLTVAYPKDGAGDYEYKNVVGGAQCNVFTGGVNLTRKNFYLPAGIYMYKQGNDYHLTNTGFELKGITLESRFDTLYGKDATADDLAAILTDPQNVNVYAYYGLAAATFDAAKALKGEYASDDNWYCYKIADKTAEEYTWYTLAVTDDSTDTTDGIDETDAAIGEGTTDVRLTASYTVDEGEVTETTCFASVVVKLTRGDTAYTAKDAAGNKVEDGVAAKFNDAAGFAEYLVGDQQPDEGTIFGAVRFHEIYANENYYFGAPTGQEDTTKYIADLTDTDNKTYTVQYTPYNEYTDVPAAGKYVLGTPAVGDDPEVFLPYADPAEDAPDGVSSLKEVAFRDAGLYTITERVSRYNETSHEDETFDRVFFVVIEQADLQITQATDTVARNTKVQNHTFKRFVEGQNGEKVFGTFSFAEKDVDSLWGNDEDLEVNPNIQMLKNIKWEFNVFGTDHYDEAGTTPVDGKKNLNNYLDQNDGESAAEQAKEENVGKDVQNNYYKGENGVLSYSEAVDIVPVPMQVTFTHVNKQADLVTPNDDNGNAQQVALNGDETNGVYRSTVTSQPVPTDPAKYPGPVYATKDQVHGGYPYQSVYAEDIAISGELTENDVGYRVVVGDKISGESLGGTKITEAPALAETGFDAGTYNQNDATAKMIKSEDGTYLGDYYVVTVKAGNRVVKTFEYVDNGEVEATKAKYDGTTAGSANVISKLKEQVYDALPACEYYNVDAYEITVNYVGLYYTSQTGAGRAATWEGTEEFRWVVSGVRFWLDVAQRDVTIKNTADFDKIYDGTAYLVKQTVDGETGDVTAAEKYIVDLNKTNESNSKFAKQPNVMLNNYIDPADDAHGNVMKIELAGDYYYDVTGEADANKGNTKTVIIKNARLLRDNPYRNSLLASAGAQVDALNYNIIDRNGTEEAGLGYVAGDIDVAQMHFTHKQYGVGAVRDNTPMHEMFDIHAKAYLLTMTDGVGRDQPDGFYDVLTMKLTELVEADDAKTGAAAFETNSSKFDYDVWYAIVQTDKYEQYREDKKFAISSTTGAVTTVAEKTMGENPALSPAIKVSVFKHPNFKLVPQAESETNIYNACTLDSISQNSKTYSDEIYTHIIRFSIVGNNNNYDLLLPVDQLNNRAVYTTPEAPAEPELITAYTPGRFINRTGGTVATAAANGEKYDYVAVYPNGDSAQFEFTVPQDSYLEDVKIVAVKNADKTAYKTYNNGTTAVPTFDTLKADSANVIGTFNTQATETTGMNNIANPLWLTLDKVNGDAVASAAYFGGSKAESAKGYTATQFADANEQIGGSTYTFTLTTGACNLGLNYAIAVVPVIKPYGALLDDHRTLTTGTGLGTPGGMQTVAVPYKSNLSVEKTIPAFISSTYNGTLTFTGAQDDYVYVNYKTLWDTTAGVSGQFGTVNMRYTAADGDIGLEQILSANFKDQFNSFGINTEGEGNTTFFNPATLIPGTEVTVTLKLWRNGAAANLQNVSAAANDNDVMDTVTFTWTVSEDDYYRLFKDDIAVLRSSNAMEADTALATAQKTDNIYGYIVSSDLANVAFNNATVILKDAAADTAVTALLKSADAYVYADRDYVGTRTINGSIVTYVKGSENPKDTLDDLARYLGALYRGETKAAKIDYNGVEYTWNTDGTLKGSNWEDKDGNTLVSTITADFTATPSMNKLSLTVDGEPVSIEVADFTNSTGTWAVKSNFDVLSKFADTWYKCDTTEVRRTIDTTAKTMSDLTAGDNLYPTYEVVTLYASDFTGDDHIVIGTGTETRTPSVVGYAHLIGGKLDLDSAFASKTLADVNGIKTTADYPAADKLVDLTKYAVPYTVYGWYSAEACAAGNEVTDAILVNTTAGAADLYAKVAVNTVKLTDGTSTIGYAAYNAKAEDPITIDFTKADFASDAPVQGTKYVTAAKDLKNYDKPRYTGETWYTDASFTTPVEYSGDPAVYVAVNASTEFFLKSTYSGGGGGGGGGYAPIIKLTYPVNVTNATASKTKAAAGETVTITVTPKKGFTLEALTVLDKNGKKVEVKDLGNNKYSFKMPASEVEVKATYTEDNTMLNFFVDVKATDYFYDAVLWAAENGITKGTDDVHFSPDMGTTRAQVVTFLWRAAGCPEPKGNAGKFTDVEVGSYYEKAVAWAIEQGITKGTSDTTFSPDMICTRAQIVTFLARFAGVEDADTASAFTDVKTTDYFAAAVKWAKDNGVTEGTSATTFSPNDDCTRAQIVTFLYRWMVK